MMSTAVTNVVLLARSRPVHVPNVRPRGYVMMYILYNKQIVVDAEDITVYIDKGSVAGDLVTYPGEGDQHPDMAAGDVKFKIVVLPHKRFVRDGDDLRISVTISLLEVFHGMF